MINKIKFSKFKKKEKKKKMAAEYFMFASVYFVEQIRIDGELIVKSGCFQCVDLKFIAK